MKHFLLLKLILIFSVAFIISGCEDSRVKDLRTRVEEIRKTHGPEVQSKVEAGLPTPKSTNYQPDAVRAPFMPSNSFAKGKGGELSNPLLTYPLTMLRFVGTVSQDKTTYAFVATPDNLIYQIKQGDAIGDNNGRVVSVTADRLNVIEQLNESGKSEVQRVVTLQLKDEGE